MAFLSHLLRARRTLSGRMVQSFLPAAVIVLGAAAGISYASARTSLRDSVLEGLEAIAVLQNQALDQWIEAQTRIISLMASDPTTYRLARGDSATTGRQLDALVQRIARSGNDFDEVFVLSAQGGRVLASTRPGRVGAYHTTATFFLKGRDDLVVQNVYDSPETGLPTLTVAAPVRNPQGEPAFILAGHINLGAGLSESIAGRGPVSHARAYLVTRNHSFVSASGLGAFDAQRGVHSVGISAATLGENGAGAYDDYRGRPVLGAYRSIDGRELALLVEVPERDALAASRALLVKVLILALFACLALWLGVRYSAFSITKPLEAVSEAAAMVAAGDFTAVAPEKSLDEVGDLARSFNAMTVRLHDLYGDLEGQVEVTGRALAALEKSRSLLQSIIDNSTALIAVTDATGKLVLANQPLIGLLGVPAEEAPGARIEELAPTSIAGEWSVGRVAAFETNAVVQREIEWPGPNHVRTYHCVWFPLSDENSVVFGVGVIATDLTERKRIEEERFRFETQFQHTQKLESLGVLAGGIAHDFNNILAAILGHADLAHECLEDDPDEVREHLDQVVSASERAAELTNQMLAYAGRSSMRVETVDLNEAIRDMTELVSVSLAKKVALELELSEEALSVRADPAQISQILMNLMTNAAQAVGDEQGRVTVTTEASVGPGGVLQAVMRVSDTGCGMDPVTLERIFDPFFTTKETGRGLGLAAVTGIIKGLGGQIDVASEKGVGTTFEITLPSAPEPEAEATAAPEIDAQARYEGTVLVVEDEAAVRRVAKGALERSGFTVLEAEDGIQALEVYGREASRVQIVVLDLSMPGMSGREVLEALQAADASLPVLITSGYDESDAAGDILMADNTRYLQKPYRPAALCDAVQSLLEGTSAEVNSAAVL